MLTPASHTYIPPLSPSATPFPPASSFSLSLSLLDVLGFAFQFWLWLLAFGLNLNSCHPLLLTSSSKSAPPLLLLSWKLSASLTVCSSLQVCTSATLQQRGSETENKPHVPPPTCNPYQITDSKTLPTCRIPRFHSVKRPNV